MADLATRAAGRYLVEIEIDGVWTKVFGIQSFEPKFNPKTEDDTDIDSDGFASEAVVGNGLTVALSGLAKGDATGGVYTLDPGLAAILEAGSKGDSEGHIHMRHRRRDGLTGSAFNLEYYAAAKVSPSGGKVDELQKFTGDLTGRGKPITLSPIQGSGTFVVSVGGATGGNFTLNFAGSTTANIAHDATVTAVKNALVALNDGFKASDWTAVTDAAGWKITTPNGGELTGTGTGLTGGALSITEA